MSYVYFKDRALAYGMVTDGKGDKEIWEYIIACQNHVKYYAEAHLERRIK